MRKLVDPYGISLLDLLSNALGALILLFLIVSVGSRGSGDERIDLADSDGNGASVSSQKYKPGDVVDSLYTIQLDLYGGFAKIKFSSNYSANWTAYKFDSDEIDMLNKNDSLKETLLIAQIKNPAPFKELKFNLVPVAGQQPLCEKVGVNIFKGNRPVISDFFSFSFQDTAKDITITQAGVSQTWAVIK